MKRKNEAENSSKTNISVQDPDFRQELLFLDPIFENMDRHLIDKVFGWKLGDSLNMFVNIGADKRAGDSLLGELKDQKIWAVSVQLCEEAGKHHDPACVKAVSNAFIQNYIFNMATHERPVISPTASTV